MADKAKRIARNPTTAVPRKRVPRGIRCYFLATANLSCKNPTNSLTRRASGTCLFFNSSSSSQKLKGELNEFS
jgi:hypothetical protein